MTRYAKKKTTKELQLHNSQDGQYTSQAYFDLTKGYGITPSMSRRGNCYDNAMAENFFSTLKTEYLYKHLPTIFDEAGTLIDKYKYNYIYIYFYTTNVSSKNRNGTTLLKKIFSYQRFFVLSV